MTAGTDSALGELADLLARERVRETIGLVARGEDRRDPVLITAAFWPDAAVDFGIFAGGFDDYLAWVTPGSPAVPVTQHVLGQSVITVDGATALAETQVLAYHRVDYGTEHRDVLLGGRYLDRLEERAGAWRIAHRTMLYDWTQDLGVAADLSEGVMGAPFSAPHFSGRASDDHSVAFFGTTLPRS